jgi:hypothetical protein
VAQLIKPTYKYVIMSVDHSAWDDYYESIMAPDDEFVSVPGPYLYLVAQLELFYSSCKGGNKGNMSVCRNLEIISVE